MVSKRHSLYKNTGILEIINYSIRQNITCPALRSVNTETANIMVFGHVKMEPNKPPPHAYNYRSYANRVRGASRMG